MAIHLSRNWWALALRGFAAVLAGMVALLSPLFAVSVFVVSYGAYLLLDGCLALTLLLRGKGRHGRWWALLLEGVAGVVTGLIVLVWPEVSAYVLLYLIAGWSVVAGLLKIMAAIRLWREVSGEWMLALSGVLSVLFGLGLMAWPEDGAKALAYLVGGYLLVRGALWLLLANRLRQWGQGIGPDQAAASELPARQENPTRDKVQQ